MENSKNWVLVAHAYGDHSVIAESASYRDAVLNAQLYLDTSERPTRMSAGWYEIGNHAAIMSRRVYDRAYNN
jgi:hypothetical protein